MQTAESQAATTEAIETQADANVADAPSAESAPAVVNADESSNRKAKDGYSERIDELTRNWRETERELERERRERRELEREYYSRQERPTQPPPSGEQETKTLADFGFDERAYGQYVRQVAAETAKREVEGFRKEAEQERARAERAKAQSSFADRATAWAKEQKLEDSERMFADPRDGGPIVTETMADTILDSDMGPALLHYLTKNRATASNIARMTPIQQAREIGRLEAKLSSAPQPKQVSEAPPPAPRIDGAATGASVNVKADDPDSDKLSDAAWAKARQRQLDGRKNAALRRS